MDFNWINWCNMAVVAYLIIINIIAAKKEVSESFCSKYPVINIFEQAGRYASMTLMILPLFTRGWEFGFMSVMEMLIWSCATVLLLAVYGLLWMKKSAGGAGILYGTGGNAAKSKDRGRDSPSVFIIWQLFDDKYPQI